MATETTKFYNMIVHLVKNNKLYEENVAVKHAWQKGDNLFFDFYFYGSRRSYVFDAMFVHDLLDLNSEKFYKTPQIFFEDFCRSCLGQAEKASPKMMSLNSRLLDPLRGDLVLMVFMALSGGELTAVKQRIIYDYICRKIPAANSLTEQYISSFLSALEPAVSDFYIAIESLHCKTPDEAEEILRELIKICLSDGRLCYEEKINLAEVLEALRLQGVEADIGL